MKDDQERERREGRERRGRVGCHRKDGAGSLCYILYKKEKKVSGLAVDPVLDVRVVVCLSPRKATAFVPRARWVLASQPFQHIQVTVLSGQCTAPFAPGAALAS